MIYDYRKNPELPAGVMYDATGGMIPNCYWFNDQTGEVGLAVYEDGELVLGETEAVVEVKWFVAPLKFIPVTWHNNEPSYDIATILAEVKAGRVRMAVPLRY